MALVYNGFGHADTPDPMRHIRRILEQGVYSTRDVWAWKLPALMSAPSAPHAPRWETWTLDAHWR